MLPRVLAVAAAGCTAFLVVSARSAHLSPAWAAPAVVFLVAVVTTMTPLARRKPVRMALAGLMVLAALGISTAFYVLMGHQPNALVFGALFLVGGVGMGWFSR